LPHLPNSFKSPFKNSRKPFPSDTRRITQKKAKVENRKAASSGRYRGHEKISAKRRCKNAIINAGTIGGAVRAAPIFENVGGETA
jgi:hypothetical protein